MTSFVQRIREDSDDTRYYGIEPQYTSKALMFELRTKDGRRKAYAYSYMTEANYDPEKGIIINVSDVTISITGRSLDEIFNHLVSNRLTYVQEDYSGIDDEEASVFVQGIEVNTKAT